MIQELGTGGAERILVSAYRGAREAGHEVFVAAAPGPLAKELDGEPYPLPLVHRKPWRVPAAALAVRRAVGATRPDVVHAHNPTMALAAATGIREISLKLAEICDQIQDVLAIGMAIGVGETYGDCGARIIPTVYVPLLRLANE